MPHSPNFTSARSLSAAIIIAFLSLTVVGQTVSAGRPSSEPTVADYPYGKDSERQKFDFWKADSAEPTPVVLLIHGGGWNRGDKSGYRGEAVQVFLDRGISVAAINYRYITQAMEQGVDPPVKACVEDAARALQTIRYKSKEWGIDGSRVGATGTSAGACTSLWLAFHSDLAIPTATDPISRESTRIACAAVSGAQTSLDPQELREWIPNAEYGGHAFGFWKEGRSRPEEFELLIENREQKLPLIKEYSPIELVSSDDPPIYLDYPNQKSPPTLGQREEDPTHSAVYGVMLKAKLDAAGVETVLNYPGHEDGCYESFRHFLIEKLTTD